MIGKYGRNYRLDIYTPGSKLITITAPITIIFSVTRNTLSSANRVNITLYNLKEDTRNQIYKDRYTTTEYWQVRLWAGYGSKLSEIFTGNLYEGYSSKKGTEWVTELDCFDGMNAIQNGYTSTTISSGTDKSNIITTVLSDMPNLLKGVFGSPASGESPRGKVLMGPSIEIVNQETEGQYYIDCEKLNVITDDEVLTGDVVVLDSSQLLASPQRRETMLEVSTLFQPQLQVGNIYEINSLQAKYNGQYKVMGFTHNVTISQASCGESTTQLSLYYGAAGLTEVG